MSGRGRLRYAKALTVTTPATAFLLVMSLISPPASAFVLTSPYASGCTPNFPPTGITISSSAPSPAYNWGGAGNWSFSTVGQMEMSLQTSGGTSPVGISYSSSARFITSGSFSVGTAPSTCYSPSTTGTYQISVIYAPQAFQFDPILAVGCTGWGSSSDASFSVNVTADMFDTTSGTFVLVGGHSSILLDSHTLTCSGIDIGPLGGPFTPIYTYHYWTGGAELSSPAIYFNATLVFNHSYLFWIGSYVATATDTQVSGSFPQNATAYAQVFNLDADLTTSQGSIDCQSC